ncbi:MAG: M28 family peptidase [Candidatus Rokubacteria bacterium]|nr:M28 family peptidase [Candidatus Rokubacteria bacterium]
MTPLEIARLLEGRSNAEREATVLRWLEARGVPVARHRVTLDGGRGENLAVDLGAGDRVLVLCAHHDAVPGSPGANDNAAAVGVLLHLLARAGGAIPPGLRVRCLFTACEELDYLGARAWVRDVGVAGLVGVLSLELVGIGDSLVVWDAVEESPFLARVRAALEGLGLRADAGYHVVGRIPRFGSDHRAFAAAGVPAYGLTLVPGASAEALRRFVFHPRRSALGFLLRRPAPFRTYHTPRDRSDTLEPAALAAAGRALDAIIAELGGRSGRSGPEGTAVSHRPPSGVS